jgi:hypothetical protein
MKSTYEMLNGSFMGRNHLRDICIDGRVILKRILKAVDVKIWTRFRLRLIPLLVCCEYGDEHSSSTKDRIIFLD